MIIWKKSRAKAYRQTRGAIHSLLAVSFATHLYAADPSSLPESQESQAAESAQLLELLAEWRKPGHKNDDELRRNLIHAAVNLGESDVVKEVAAGGDVARLEIILPSDESQVEAKAVLNFGDMPEVSYNPGALDCVIRRMTKTRFEVWTPTHGWLFDSTGKLINEAFPPRRDGIGREWHGAFLPDGRWVTTDLWDYDRTLTFFSRDGKWQKEITAAQLAPNKKSDFGGVDILGWARCDKRGEGWIVSIGSDGGRAVVFVKPRGKAHLLGEDEPWELCYPRDLEPKGCYTELKRPSDDLKSKIILRAAAHGLWVGYPTYTWGKNEKVVSDGASNFGFLPRSHNVFIGTGFERPGRIETWFFGSGGKCLGWISADYLTDSADLKSMWFLDEKDSVVTLGLDLKPQSRMHFVIGGANAKPVKLFTDLRLGFFNIDNHLILARW